MCEDENGNTRPCRVEWSDEASNTNVTAETMEAAQQLADNADVDLLLSSGRRAEGSNCNGSRHNCGKAFDIKAINGVDIGDGQEMNPDAISLISRVQGAAFEMNQVRENYGPLGLWKAESAGLAPNRIGYSTRSRRSLGLGHLDHIHISIQ